MFMRVVFLSFLLVFGSFAFAGLEDLEREGALTITGMSLVTSATPFLLPLLSSPGEVQERSYGGPAGMGPVYLIIPVGISSSPFLALGYGSDKAIEGSENSIEEDSSSSFSENAYDDESERRKDSTEKISEIFAE